MQVFRHGQSVRICQHSVSKSDAGKVLQFGPLSETLGALFERGLWLETSQEVIRLHHQQPKTKIYLMSEQKRWLLKKERLDLMGEIQSLSVFLRDFHDCTNACSTVPIDPWKALLERYPVKVKSPSLIGNMTLKEVVLEQLSADGEPCF